MKSKLLITRDLRSPNRAQSTRYWLAWMALAVGLAATGLAWHFSTRQVREQTRLRLAQEVDHNIAKLQERMLLCESVVHGAQGLYAASKSVERREWKVYGQGLFADKEYPGVRALLSISFVPETNLASFLKITRNDDSPDFSISPPGKRGTYYPIKFIQSKGSGTHLVGMDVGLMPALQESLMAACDSGSFTLTSPIRLTATETEPPEVLLILPVFRNDAPHDTVADRRLALEAWVAALLPVADLAAGLSPAETPGLSFQIFDDTASTPLLYEQGVTQRLAVEEGSQVFLEKVSQLTLGNRQWRVVFQSGTHFSSATELAFPALVLTTGCLVSLFCFYLLKSLANTRAQAIEMAATMTRSLLDRERQLHLALQSANMGVWEWDTQNDTFVCSEELGILCGLKSDQRPTTRQGFLELIVPEDRARIAQSLQNAFELKQPHHETYQVVWPDGSIRRIDSRGSIQRDHSGQSPKLMGVAMDITHRHQAEKQVEELNRRLIETSRQAGMAEVATSVLHNVGNVLNSVNVSTDVVLEQIRESKTPSLVKAVQLIRDHRDQLGKYLAEDPKGRQIPDFLGAVADQLLREQQLLAAETKQLKQNVEHIKQIVAMQQSHAKVGGVFETLPAVELVETALQMCSVELEENRIQIIREFHPAPPIHADRHRVLQILINLINNARHALEQVSENRRIAVAISVSATGSKVDIEVADNGVGITPDNLTRIFQHGFTTRKTGHGFGLHSCANAASEMSGSLRVRSDGPGHGATFLLELPAASENSALKAA